MIFDISFCISCKFFEILEISENGSKLNYGKSAR